MHADPAEHSTFRRGVAAEAILTRRHVLSTVAARAARARANSEQMARGRVHDDAEPIHAGDRIPR
eukprot:2580754-Pyramimonas_sp.AAC.1